MVLLYTYSYIYTKNDVPCLTAFDSCQKHRNISMPLCEVYCWNSECTFPIYSKLRTSDAGQMVLNMSVALICHHTTLNLVFFERHANNIPMCFVSRMFADYFSLVYGFLISAEAVNMFVKVVLVFPKIDHFPLKASLATWSKLSCFDYHFFNTDYYMFQQLFPPFLLGSHTATCITISTTGKHTHY